MKLGLTKAFKRIEPDDGKLSSPVLRGRRRWENLFCYPTIKIVILSGLYAIYCSPSVTTSSILKPNPKPNLQKVYNEALRWSKTKLEEMHQPQDLQDTSGIGLCKRKDADKSKTSEDEEKSPGILERLPIVPGCHKKNQKNVDEVLDQVMVEGQGFQEGDDKILVFISFSMPKASLLALSQEAEKHHAVLVMRGLKDDSFKATQIAFQELGSDMLSGIEINPEAFEIYQIKQVPVFVRVKSTTGKEVIELGRISGNVSLAFAAQKLRELRQ